MAKKLFLPIGLGLLAVVGFVLIAQASGVEAQVGVISAPIGLVVDFEKYNQDTGEYKTIINTWMTVPYSVTAQSWAPPPGVPNNIGWNGAVPTDTASLVGFKPWLLTVVDNPYSAAPTTFFYFHDAKNDVGYTGCQPQGGIFNGPIVSVMVTDMTGPKDVVTNTTGIPVDMIWFNENSVIYQQDLNIQPGQTVNGPSFWKGSVSILPTHWNDDGVTCWYVAWDLHQWMPAGIPTPTPAPLPTRTPPPPAVFPIGMGVTWEKYDPLNGTNTTTIQTHIGEPHALRAKSARALYYWEGNIPDNLVGLVNLKPFEVSVKDPSAFDATFNQDRIFASNDWYYYGAGESGCAPDLGQPYQGSGAWSVSVTDQTIGPVVTFRNTTPYTLTVTWYSGVLPPVQVAVSGSLAPGEQGQSPTGIWTGAAVARNMAAGVNTICSSSWWNLKRWMPALPAPTATSTNIPTPTSTAIPTATVTATVTPMPTTTATPYVWRAFFPLVIKAP